MKKSFVWFLAFVPAAFAYACGGSDNSNIDGGGDATTSDGPGSDVVGKNDSGGMDSSQNMDSSNADGGSQDARSDVTLNIACTKPADCVDGGDPDAAYPPTSSGVVCCANATTSGMFPKCSIDSVVTQCKPQSACPTMVDTTSCGSDQLRACAHNTECTETGYTSCCYVNTDGGKAAACFNAGVAAYLGLTCMP